MFEYLKLKLFIFANSAKGIHPGIWKCLIGNLDCFSNIMKLLQLFGIILAAITVCMYIIFSYQKQKLLCLLVFVYSFFFFFFFEKFKLPTKFQTFMVSCSRCVMNHKFQLPSFLLKSALDFKTFEIFSESHVW